MSDLNDWIRLCNLVDDDPELLPTVRSAAASGDDEAWVALLDGLDDAGALAYLDRGDTAVELADALAQLPRVFASGAEVDEVGDVDGPLPVAIARADSILAPFGLRAVYLEEDAESFPLVVVPASNAAEILEIAERLGFTARVFS
ncbi:DUF6630 family protein [Microbacterium sp. A588]